MASSDRFLANEYVTVFESPSPVDIFCYSPGIAVCPGGRLIATCDLGGMGVSRLDGIKTDMVGDFGRCNQGRIFISDDKGDTWRHVQNFPMLHARPFIAGDSLYIIGHAGDLGILRSDDWGETWSKTSWLTHGQKWHQAPCNVWHANGNIYLVMERNTKPEEKFWNVCSLAPVVMAGGVDADLTQKSAWRFSNELSFTAAVERPVGLGVPFYNPGSVVPADVEASRDMAPIGWLETNIVQFTDPKHVWFDPAGRTFHLWMRGHTGTVNLACIAKVVEDETGKLTVSLEQAPSGETMLYVPCPGGHLKFHILFDETSGLFWMVSSQSTDSMTRPEMLPADRYNLPCNERNRLVLHFSKNCIDWCFAGVVAMGETAKESRNYASMAVVGEDLCILSRSGDRNAKSAHDVNFITFHKVRNFRKLIY